MSSKGVKQQQQDQRGTSSTFLAMFDLRERIIDHGHYSGSSLVLSHIRQLHQCVNSASLAHINLSNMTM